MSFFWMAANVLWLGSLLAIASVRLADGQGFRSSSTSGRETGGRCPSAFIGRRRPYIGFVVDDTGSMANEISGVKLWIEDCLDGDDDDSDNDDECANTASTCWLFTTFNDPTTGPVVGPDLNTVEDAVGAVVVSGGGDCPELAFTGLRNLVDAVPIYNAGCKIFFFTDAGPKDGYLFGQVLAKFTQKGCGFYPILTGCCGPCEDVCISTKKSFCKTSVRGILTVPGKRRTSVATSVSSVKPTERLYYLLAERTGGKVVLTKKPKSGRAFLRVLKKEVRTT